MGATPDPPPPPPTVGDHLLRQLETKEGADVTFKVGEAEFAAHSLVLSARSPVFRAMLSVSGSLPPPAAQRDGAGRRFVPINDGTGAAAFSGLLHFVYGDALPSSAVGGGATAITVAGELLGAANRYGMERMRVLCEGALREAVVDAATATAALVIADRHGSGELKSFCVEYVAAPKVLKEAVRTEGYAELKASRPCVVAEILERVAAGPGSKDDGKQQLTADEAGLYSTVRLPPMVKLAR